MAFNSAPASFFGSTYALGSSIISLFTATHAVASISTFTVNAATDVITVGAAHNLVVGDIVQVSSATTLPAGLAATTNYYVKTVPSTTTLTLSATSGGSTIDITDTGTGTHTIYAGPLLNEVTDTEANASTGDWRKVLFGLMEMIFDKWTGTATADRPEKVSVTRSVYEDPTTLEQVNTYTVIVRTQISGQEVSAE